MIEWLFSLIHLTLNICTKSSSPSSFTSEQPYFVETLEPVEVTVGEPVTLRCRIAGTPDISVVWFKADGNLRKSETCSMDFSNGVATLKLMKTTKFDQSEFICKAENRVGSASISCNVTVKGDACFNSSFSMLMNMPTTDCSLLITIDTQTVLFTCTEIVLKISSGEKD